MKNSSKSNHLSHLHEHCITACKAGSSQEHCIRLMKICLTSGKPRITASAGKCCGGGLQLCLRSHGLQSNGTYTGAVFVPGPSVLQNATRCYEYNTSIQGLAAEHAAAAAPSGEIATITHPSTRGEPQCKPHPGACINVNGPECLLFLNT